MLEDAQGPEALPDGSLLVVKRDAARNFQIHRFRPDTGELDRRSGPPSSRRAGRWSLRAFPDGKTAVFWGRLAGSDGLRAPRVPAGRRDRQGDAVRAAASAGSPPLAIGADGNSVLAFVTVGDLQQAISVSRDGEQGKILFPVTGKPWGLDAGAGRQPLRQHDGQPRRASPVLADGRRSGSSSSRWRATS